MCGIWIGDGASFMGFETMASKRNEKDMAKRFFTELGTPLSELLTLKEFARRDPDPNFNLEHLDSVCPDIVAITAGVAIGLELTAYSGSDSDNGLNEVMRDLSDTGSELAENFSELRGFEIHVSPNKEIALRKRDVRMLATQLLEFVGSMHAASPFDTGQDRHYSVHGARSNQRPFADWHLLDQHVQSITVQFRQALQDIPVMLSGGFGTHFGTRLDLLTQTLVKKADQLAKAYTRGLSGMWLLIHATGQPRSSRIAPMWREEAERLVQSAARQTAIDSGFERVFLWDGVRGGLVDLVRAESKVVERA
jgi:hypothetical protein